MGGAGGGDLVGAGGNDAQAEDRVACGNHVVVLRNGADGTAQTAAAGGRSAMECSGEKQPAGVPVHRAAGLYVPGGAAGCEPGVRRISGRSEEHTSELQSRVDISY